MVFPVLTSRAWYYQQRRERLLRVRRPRLTPLSAYALAMRCPVLRVPKVVSAYARLYAVPATGIARPMLLGDSAAVETFCDPYEEEKPGYFPTCPLAGYGVRYCHSACSDLYNMSGTDRHLVLPGCGETCAVGNKFDVLVRPEVKYKKPRSQYNLHEEGGFLYLISGLTIPPVLSMCFATRTEINGKTAGGELHRPQTLRVGVRDVRCDGGGVALRARRSAVSYLPTRLLCDVRY
eukprot:1191849-Rhodomonas_salina.1